jgi:DNA-binding MarR family transcriptional regulator
MGSRKKSKRPAASLYELAEFIFSTTEHIMRQVKIEARAEMMRETGAVWLGDLSVRQLHTIVALRRSLRERREGIKLCELAHLLGVTTASASTMVDGLVESGHLKRVVRPEDRRSVRIGLSKGTEELLRQRDESLAAKLLELISPAPTEMIREWCTVLEKVRAAMQAHAQGDDAVDTVDVDEAGA